MSNYYTCNLWKITLKSKIKGFDHDLVFWGYNITEKAAKASSIRWADDVEPEGDYLIHSVELLK